MKNLIIVERYADNGEFSHFEVIDSETGESLGDASINIPRLNPKQHTLVPLPEEK